MGIGFAIGAVLLLLCASALVSGSEVAFFSLDSQDKEELANDGSPKSRKILKLISAEQYKFLLATILILNNVFNVAIVIVSYYIFSNLFDFSNHPALGFIVNVVGVTSFLLLFGEIMPKVYANLNDLKMARFMSGPLDVCNGFLKRARLSIWLAKASDLLEKRIQKYQTNSIDIEEINSAIDLTVGQKSTEQINILKGIVQFGNISVTDVMQPRIDIFALPIDTTFDKVLTLVNESGYSRIPVFEEDLDNLKGVLYVKDLLAYLNMPIDFKWQELLRSAFFVPESKKIDDLLRQMKGNRTHLAIVVDEYGGTEGLVTLEDILEEVIGEIKDEFDAGDEIEFRKIDDQNFVFEGKTLLNDICKVMNLNINTFDEVKGEADSLAGLVLEITGKIPESGDKLEYANFMFSVESLDKNRIQKVKVTVLELENES